MELTARSRHDHDSNVSPNFVKIAIRSAEGPRPQILEPLLLGWMNEQLKVPGLARFSEAVWGDDRVRMVDVSERL